MERIRQAVLLAAGQGTRLAPLTDDRPKCMVPVNGTTIVDHLIDCVEAAGIEQLVVVTGFCGEMLAEHLGRRRGKVDIRCIDNPVYSTTNNIYSLWLADPVIEQGFLLLESDILCEPAALAPMVQPDRMAVSRYQPTMDGTGVRLAPDGAVQEMILRAHAVLPDELPSLHKTVNFYSFSATTWQEVYRPVLAQWIEREQLNDYYEAPLADLINAGEVAMQAVDFTDSKWAEIDNRADLARAEQLFGAAGK